jgi:predicted peptidase
MKNLNPILLLSLALVLSACTSNKNFSAMNPATKAGQTAQKFSITETRTLSADYLLFLPEGYGADAGKKWPLILFLHGAGERGTDVWMVAKHGPAKIDTTATNFPFIVVSPLCPKEQSWSDDVLLALLDDVEKKYPVDTKRVYLTGLSMGGFGVWNLALSHPERFAAAAPICGGGETILLTLAKDFDKDKIAPLQSLPVWAFHGGKDPVVSHEESERMVEALKKFGVKEVKLTIYPDALHDSWTQTYANPELFTWFLQHSR